MGEVNFKSDIFVSELLCAKCSNCGECEFTGENGEKACETYKYLEAIVYPTTL